MKSTEAMKSFPVMYGKISSGKNVFSSLEVYVELVNDYRNMPNGVYSDLCIAKISGGCEMTEKCEKLENYMEISFGYSQTHK